jgi:hypothetical protein
MYTRANDVSSSSASSDGDHAGVGFEAQLQPSRTLPRSSSLLVGLIELQDNREWTLDPRLENLLTFPLKIMNTLFGFDLQYIVIYPRVLMNQ